MKPLNQNSLHKIVFQEDDIRWQSLIYELVRSGRIDPWNLDISLFSKEYLKLLQKLKQMNFRISGKVILAAAILLKLKTNRLGLTEFIGLLEEPEDEVEQLDEGESELIDEDEAKLMKLATHIEHQKKKNYFLEPKIPDTRTRKVTVFELMGALKKALEVDQRREVRHAEIKQIETPKKLKINKVDILGKIKAVYERLLKFARNSSKNHVDFSQILPSKTKKDVIWTFVPLLHLANQNKVRLHQDKPFAPLKIEVLDKDLKIKK